MDIIVTTPKTEIKNAVKEAEEAKAGRVQYYFRRLASFPKDLKVGDKVFYVEDNYITGCAVVSAITNEAGEQCSTTKKNFTSGVFVWMKCDSWQWIKPIPMRGFQGYRYRVLKLNYEVVGNWLDPKPKVSDKVYCNKCEKDVDQHGCFYSGCPTNNNNVVNDRVQNIVKKNDVYVHPELNKEANSKKLIDTIIPEEGEKIAVLIYNQHNFNHVIRKICEAARRDVRKQFHYIYSDFNLRGVTWSKVLMFEGWYRDKRTDECWKMEEQIKYRNIPVIKLDDRFLDPEAVVDMRSKQLRITDIEAAANKVIEAYGKPKDELVINNQYDKRIN
jgi:hypothetical protein